MNEAQLPATISNVYPRQSLLLRVIIVFAFATLAVGLVSPIITLEKFVFLENTFSVLSGILQLLNEGQWFLFILISGFSVILPAVKLMLLSLLVSANASSLESMQKYLHWMHVYGKWSMLDVFVVAILVVSVKLGVMANVQMRFGLYFFAASVLLTMFVTARVVALSAALDHDGSRQKQR